MGLKTRRDFMRDGLAATAGMMMPALGFAHSAPKGPINASGSRPNIIMILADDMGFSDLNCYGSDIHTPTLNGLAKGGLQFTQFYNNPRCCPSRACLMTGLYPHQAGFGMMTAQYGRWDFPAYRGDLSDRCVTIAEALRLGGYHTAMCGKWHLTPPTMESKHNWPLQRGFEKYFGTIAGASSYYDPHTLTRDNTPTWAKGEFYYTDALADNAVKYVDEYGGKKDPFFLYLAFTSPHWPLQALREDIAKYKDRYHIGWDAVRAERHKRQIEMGIVDEKWEITPRDPRVPPWELAQYHEWEARRMAVYAAQVDRMDQGIARIMVKLRQLGIDKNTLIMFMSDNGGNYEELGAPGVNDRLPIYAAPHETPDGRLVRMGNNPALMPGPEDTYQSYGIPWGNASNTPFKLYKHYCHEGGISSPFIAYWPEVIEGGKGLTKQIGHESDVMATCLDVAGVKYPEQYKGHEIIPLEGKSLVPIFQGKRREGHKALFWEHEGNSAVRMGKLKLVSKYPNYWELHDMEADRTELHDVADKHPQVVKEMAGMYANWAKYVGVHSWPLPGMRLRGPGVPKYLKR